MNTRIIPMRQEKAHCLPCILATVLSTGIEHLSRNLRCLGAEPLADAAGGGRAHHPGSIAGLVMALFLSAALSPAALAQIGRVSVPPVPDNLRVPDGQKAYMKTSAVGTQNYICLPSADGPTWTFLGPQATVFIKYPWFGREASQQVASHYLSPNPEEAGAARPAWQHSVDSSTVWGKAIANSTDPQFVAPGAIPWLLVEIAGRQPGPMGGSAMTITTYIHRLNTSGGMKPDAGCEISTIGALALVPYTTDYYFYKLSR